MTILTIDYLDFQIPVTHTRRQQSERFLKCTQAPPSEAWQPTTDVCTQADGGQSLPSP